jgi:DNA (cytosine-5)-methyltransferase 1
MRHGSLFSGIGGFDLAAEWMGWENVLHCEWKEFNQKILKYYWPNATSYSDITKTDFSIHRGTIDILTGGFPCQPYSLSGKRLGKEDDRHLWPEMLRAVREIQPPWVVGENVRGLINWNGGLVFEEVQAELEAEGYEVQPFLLPAAGVGAPHERYRIWFVAHASCFDGRSNESGGKNKNSKWKDILLHNSGSSKKRITSDSHGNECKAGDELNKQQRCPSASNGCGAVTNANGKGLEVIKCKSSDDGKKFSAFKRNINRWERWPTQSPICSRNDGISARLDGITFPKWRSESIMAAGNAIVPQVALQIFQSIQQYENLKSK